VPRKLTDAQANDLIERYLAGESTKQLGPAFGVSSRVVSDYLRRAGVRARPRHQAVVDYQAGLTHEERSALTTRGMLKRWQNAGPEDRARMLDPMHEANTGRPQPLSMKVAAARTKSAKGGPDSKYERMVGEWLEDRGVEYLRQVQVQGWTADLAVGNTLVEVTTGWARKKEWEPRFADFFDTGWNLYVVWHDTREPLLPQVADDLIAWVKILERDPSARGQHRVVWRSRQVISCGGEDAHYVAGVLRSSRPRGHWPLYDSTGH